MISLGSRARAFSLLVASLAVTSPMLGCAEGGTGLGDSGGGGTRDGGSAPDGGLARDAGRDGGVPTCGSGEHACGSGCVSDLANEPENGCRLGCGEPCDAPDMGNPSCGMDGRCTWECAPPFRRVGDECVCTPTTCEAIAYECGAPDNGCGMPLDCGSCTDGAACTTGRCACTPDGFEPNDSNTTPTVRPGLDDSDDPPDVILTANLDEMRDEDWFRFPITDGTDGGSPRMTVTLRNIPVGSDYTLSAYFVCGDAGDVSTCAMGTADNFVGRGCTGGASGSSPETVEIVADCDRTFSFDDGGTLLVRVRAATWMNTCGPYEVVVRVR